MPKKKRRLPDLPAKGGRFAKPAFASICLQFGARRKLQNQAATIMNHSRPLTLSSGGRTCFVNPHPITSKVKIPANAKIHVVHTLMTPLVRDTECTEEAIGRRANYVGSVLERIMKDMEKHWTDNLDMEEPEP
jgi:hypothetical protein